MVVAAALDLIDRTAGPAVWGQLHLVDFQHPMTAVPVVGRWLGRTWSRGPFPIGGDGTTVQATYWNARRSFGVVALPSARFIADVGSWDDTILVMAVGQSGRPWSPHYSDQLGSWLHLGGASLPFSEAAVEAAATARMTLLPAGGGD
jgi:penicillin amidase